MDSSDDYYGVIRPQTDFKYNNNIINQKDFNDYKINEYYNIVENEVPNYKIDYANVDSSKNYKIDNSYIMDSQYKIDNSYMDDSRYNIDNNYKMDHNRFNMGYKNENGYEIVNSSDSTNADVPSSSTVNSNTINSNNNNPNDYENANYYQQYPYYLNYPNIYPNHVMINDSNPLNIVNMVNISKKGNYNQNQLENSGKIVNSENEYLLNNIMKDRDKYSNSTIDNESIEDIDDKEGIKPPANRSDPIYTSISGLKWKSKSKKWVVRWDNPMTNRRVYKYFSGSRYGFMGAHKRAKYYLEFLNASVGKINSTTPGNPFCRRTEGPPKGKTNKSLIRKYYSNGNNMYFYPNLNNPGVYYNSNIAYNPALDQFTGNIDTYKPPIGLNENGEKVGSTIENPWYINQQYNNL